MLPFSSSILEVCFFKLWIFWLLSAICINLWLFAGAVGSLWGRRRDSACAVEREAADLYASFERLPSSPVPPIKVPLYSGMQIDSDVNPRMQRAEKKMKKNKDAFGCLHLHIF